LYVWHSHFSKETKAWAKRMKAWAFIWKGKWGRVGRSWKESVAWLEEEGRMGERRGDPRFNKEKSSLDFMFPCLRRVWRERERITWGIWESGRMKWQRRGGIRDPRIYLWEASSQSVEWGREGTREGVHVGKWGRVCISLGYEWVRRGAPHKEGPKTHLQWIITSNKWLPHAHVGNN
jgi:hypothetical protein